MKGLTRFLGDHPEFASFQDVVGLSLSKTKSHVFVSPPPVVDAKKCTGCNLCIPACAFDAIKMVERPGDRPLAVINDACVSCNACVGVCPPKFSAITARF